MAETIPGNIYRAESRSVVVLFTERLIEAKDEMSLTR